VHGTPDLAELKRLGIDPNAVLDFSANINPYGPPGAVRTAIEGMSPGRYPDRECLVLRLALGESLGISPRYILPGNGASELIWLAALAFVRAGDHVVVIGPTYGEYARAAQLMGARIATYQSPEDAGFVPIAAAVQDLIDDRRPRVVFVCNPNNPTGTLLDPGLVVAWARRRPRTLFVVDEAYLPFASAGGALLGEAADNVLVLRSMTKDFGLAGLRLGYAFGPEHLLEPLRRAQPPWSVNAFAQAAGIAALRDAAHRQDSLERLYHAKAALVSGLAALGLTVLPSAVCFFLVRTGDGAAFREKLLRYGMLVRDCASFGLPAYSRIAVRRPEENSRLLSVIQEVL
jgi:threonine-phosphate decarboxylase